MIGRRDVLKLSAAALLAPACGNDVATEPIDAQLDA